MFGFFRSLPSVLQVNGSFFSSIRKTLAVNSPKTLKLIILMLKESLLVLLIDQFENLTKAEEENAIAPYQFPLQTGAIAVSCIYDSGRLAYGLQTAPIALLDAAKLV
ncbi:hypothetical protein SAMN02745181_1442 [Rubritalea squalenifaciens DSM 18772]|uniref:Uncharacterized protein n=2 Tax=Rubritalea squalenifaciens TaxID=407226 RepID=A0A1M6HDD9_9BACT|nr:hypothetical protein SAMN02745181_1442 [Rubritalea squalenifaciens DSM 18772]